LTEEELAEGFARLVSNQWRPGEAGPFLKRLKAVPSVSAPYLVRHLVAGGPRERETAASLIRLLAGPRVIVPLREALKDTGLTDEARLSVSVALQGLGE
jgi:hypothetical protein